MLREAFDWITTPCDSHTRWSGHLSQFVAIAARRRRLSGAWGPHEDRSKSALLRAAEGTEPDGTALIIGAGHLHDIPLEELAIQFAHVALMDLAFSATTKRRAKALRNVSCVRHDVTECREALSHGVFDVPSPKTLIHDDRITFVASVNLLSQLPVGAAALLEKHGLTEAELEPIQKALIRAHLDWLRRFSCPAALITDVDIEVLDTSGSRADGYDPLYGLAPGEPTEIWQWDMAPPGEIDRDHAVRHHVAAFDRL